MADVNAARDKQPHPRPTLLSFSGIDGAGKTTQIAALQRGLTDAGTQVLLLSFWDDVAFGTYMRTELGHHVFGGDRGVGQPDQPVNRRDKNVKRWYMTLPRLVAYSLDTIRTILAVRQARKTWAAVVIFDRYIYDELANLFPGGMLTTAWARLLLRWTPRLDMAFLLDADPEGARARKPEYPLAFLKQNRQSYLALAKEAGMTIVPQLSESEVSLIVMHEFRKQQPWVPIEIPAPKPRSERVRSRAAGARR